MNIKFYAARNKANGCFYTFHETCDDGYGYFSPDLKTPELGDLPYAFPRKELPIYGLRRPDSSRRDENCKIDEIEFVEFTLTW